MARNTQLSKLIADLRGETGRSQKVSVGVDEKDNLAVLLARTQETLYDDYAWPHLNVEKELTLVSGQRYYDMPAGLNIERLTKIRYKYNNVYTDIDRGITFDDYSIFDSNNDERSTPALKWDVRYTTTTDQIEVWPIPNTNVDKLYFRGIKTLNPLVEETDRAEIDDRLIVLFAAHELLARQKSPDAQTKLNLANARYTTLKRNSQAESAPIQMGLGGGGRDRSNRMKTRIIVS